MILPNGRRNLIVGCDADGCVARFFAKLPTEVKALRSGNVVDVDVDPDFVMSDARARRHARHAGWATVVDGKGNDLCSSHVGVKGLILKTRVA